MSAPATAPPRSTAPVGALTVGALLVLVGLVWLADETGLLDVSWTVAVALAVGAVGLLLMVTARSPHAGGLLPVGLVLLVVLVLTSVVPGVPDGGSGDRTYRPTTAEELTQDFELGAGTLVLDLRGLPPGTTAPGTTEVSVGMGEIVVRVPDGLAVDVTASAGTGEVDVLGTRREGIGPEVAEVVGDDDDPLVLRLHVGVGSVEVTR